jgi:hypothetical protein
MIDDGENKSANYCGATYNIEYNEVIDILQDN